MALKIREHTPQDALPCVLVVKKVLPWVLSIAVPVALTLGYWLASQPAR